MSARYKYVLPVLKLNTFIVAKLLGKVHLLTGCVCVRDRDLYPLNMLKNHFPFPLESCCRGTRLIDAKDVLKSFQLRTFSVVIVVCGSVVTHSGVDRLVHNQF